MVYQPQQILNILEDLGVEVVSYNGSNFSCYCPFHYNRNTPAMSIDATRGLWICFSAACGQSGNLEQLVSKTTDKTAFEVLRYVGKFSKPLDNGEALTNMLDEMFSPKKEYEYVPELYVQSRVENFWKHPDAIEYMTNRGYSEETLRHFNIGTIDSGEMVTVPIYEPSGAHAVGFVYRGIYERVFKYSSGLPKRSLIFNLHNARKHSHRAIITEASFDTMAIHQAGYPNAVSVLGSNVTNQQIEILDRNFSELFIFVDNDEAGYGMFESVKARSTRPVLRPSGEYGKIYPQEGRKSNPKDASDLYENQIKQMIEKADNGLWI